MPTVSEVNKAESFDLSLDALKGQKRKVLAFLARHPYQTRSDLNKKLGIKIASLCSALKALENAGWVRVAYGTLDEETNRIVNTYDINQDTRVSGIVYGPAGYDELMKELEGL